MRPVRWNPSTGRLDRIADLDVTMELEADIGSDVVQRERIVPEWEDPGSATTGIASIPQRTAQPFKPHPAALRCWEARSPT